MIAQIFIAVLGVAAVWLTQQQNESLKKYACLFGIASQPFWFYASWASQQWGIFFLSFVYSGAWLMGLYNYWLKQRINRHLQQRNELKTLIKKLRMLERENAQIAERVWKEAKAINNGSSLQTNKWLFDTSLIRGKANLNENEFLQLTSDMQRFDSSWVISEAAHLGRCIHHHQNTITNAMQLLAIKLKIDQEPISTKDDVWSDNPSEYPES